MKTTQRQWRRWTAEEEAIVEDCFARGVNTKIIADKINRSSESVRTFAKIRGIRHAGRQTPARRLHHTSVNLTPDAYAQIAKECRNREISIAQFIRECITQAIGVDITLQG